MSRRLGLSNKGARGRNAIGSGFNRGRNRGAGLGCGLLVGVKAKIKTEGVDRINARLSKKAKSGTVRCESIKS